MIVGLNYFLCPQKKVAYSAITNKSRKYGLFIYNGCSKSFCKTNFDVVILDLKMKGAKKFKLVTLRHETTVKRP